MFLTSYFLKSKLLASRIIRIVKANVLLNLVPVERTKNWMRINVDKTFYKLILLARIILNGSSIQCRAIETFCPLGYIFVLGIETFWERKMYMNFIVPKWFNTPLLYTIDAHFYNPSVKIASISFLSFSDMEKSNHLLGCHAIGINSSLIFF